MFHGKFLVKIYEMNRIYGEKIEMNLCEKIFEQKNMSKASNTRIKRKAIINKPHNKTKELKEAKKQKKQQTLEIMETKKSFQKKSCVLKPPYSILLDTNFLLHTIRKKMSLNLLSTSTFLANVTLNVPDCVFAELEKLKEFLAIKVLRSMNFNRLICDHKGTYADDCLLNRTKINPCFVVATSDRALRNKFRYQSTPVVYIRGHKFVVEGMFIN